MSGEKLAAAIIVMVHDHADDQADALAAVGTALAVIATKRNVPFAEVATVLEASMAATARAMANRAAQVGAAVAPPEWLS